MSSKVAWLREEVGRELDDALEVECLDCAALVGEVCTAFDAPLLWPHSRRTLDALKARERSVA